MDVSNILTAVVHGNLDEDLDRLADAVKRRQTAIQAETAILMAVSTKPGDVIRIKTDAAIRPKYLLGIDLVVERVNQKTVSCRVKEPELLPSRRYAFGIRVPLEVTEKVEQSA